MKQEESKVENDIIAKGTRCCLQGFQNRLSYNGQQVIVLDFCRESDAEGKHAEESDEEASFAGEDVGEEGGGGVEINKSICKTNEIVYNVKPALPGSCLPQLLCVKACNLTTSKRPGRRSQRHSRRQREKNSAESSNDENWVNEESWHSNSFNNSCHSTGTDAMDSSIGSSVGDLVPKHDCDAASGINLEQSDGSLIQKIGPTQMLNSSMRDSSAKKGNFHPGMMYLGGSQADVFARGKDDDYDDEDDDEDIDGEHRRPSDVESDLQEEKQISANDKSKQHQHHNQSKRPMKLIKPTIATPDCIDVPDVFEESFSDSSLGSSAAFSSKNFGFGENSFADLFRAVGQADDASGMTGALDTTIHSSVSHMTGRFHHVASKPGICSGGYLMAPAASLAHKTPLLSRSVSEGMHGPKKIDFPRDSLRATENRGSGVAKFELDNISSPSLVQRTRSDHDMAQKARSTHDELNAQSEHVPRQNLDSMSTFRPAFTRRLSLSDMFNKQPAFGLSTHDDQSLAIVSQNATIHLADDENDDAGSANGIMLLPANLQNLKHSPEQQRKLNSTTAVDHIPGKKSKMQRRASLKDLLADDSESSHQKRIASLAADNDDATIHAQIVPTAARNQSSTPFPLKSRAVLKPPHELAGEVVIIMKYNHAESTYQVQLLGREARKRAADHKNKAGDAQCTEHDSDDDSSSHGRNRVGASHDRNDVISRAPMLTVDSSQLGKAPSTAFWVRLSWVDSRVKGEGLENNNNDYNVDKCKHPANHGSRIRFPATVRVHKHSNGQTCLRIKLDTFPGPDHVVPLAKIVVSMSKDKKDDFDWTDTRQLSSLLKKYPSRQITTKIDESILADAGLKPDEVVIDPCKQAPEMIRALTEYHLLKRTSKTIEKRGAEGERLMIYRILFKYNVEESRSRRFERA